MSGRFPIIVLSKTYISTISGFVVSCVPVHGPIGPEDLRFPCKLVPSTQFAVSQRISPCLRDFYTLTKTLSVLGDISPVPLLYKLLNEVRIIP